jgi:hypothetical protein
VTANRAAKCQTATACRAHSPRTHGRVARGHALRPPFPRAEEDLNPEPQRGLLRRSLVQNLNALAIMAAQRRVWAGLGAMSTLLSAVWACAGGTRATRPQSSDASVTSAPKATQAQPAPTPAPVQVSATASPGCNVTAGGICFASFENACKSLNCAPNPCVQSTQAEVRCVDPRVPGGATLGGAR